MAIRKYNWLTAKEETPENIDEVIMTVERIELEPIHEYDEKGYCPYSRTLIIHTDEHRIELILLSDDKEALQVQVLTDPRLV